MNYTIFFTDNCNLDCRYCYERTKKNTIVSSEGLKELIAFIAQNYKRDMNKPVSIVTHGGEPLLAYEQLKYFIEELNRKVPSVRYIITTNATLLDKEKIKFLAENYTSISVSVDGTQKAHDLNRIFKSGKGSYDEAIYWAKEMLKVRADTKARLTVTPNNVQYLYDGVKELRELGFSNIIPVPDEFNQSWTVESINELYKQGMKIIDYCTGIKNLNIGFVQDALIRVKNAVCDGGIDTMSIESNGDIYPCVVAVGHPEFKIGNIAEGIDMQRLEELQTEARQRIDECAGCSRYDYCNGTRCKIINKVMTGKSDSPSPIVCNIENIRVKLAVVYKRRSEAEE